MNKIPTLYQRTVDRRYVTDQVTPGCEWVLAGEGWPTQKLDGTCIMLDTDGNWWARREVKPGKTPPPNYLAVTDPDPETGKIMGWEPIEQSPWAKQHWEALENVAPIWEARPLADRAGTYELIGPKINGNPENRGNHVLVEHADPDLRLYDPIDRLTPEEWMFRCYRDRMEGVVWHHPDGRMAKLKVKDYPPGTFDSPAWTDA